MERAPVLNYDSLPSIQLLYGFFSIRVRDHAVMVQTHEGMGDGESQVVLKWSAHWGAPHFEFWRQLRPKHLTYTIFPMIVPKNIFIQFYSFSNITNS